MVVSNLSYSGLGGMKSVKMGIHVMIKKVFFEYLAYESLFIVTKDSGQDMHIRPKLGRNTCVEHSKKKE